MPTPYDPDEPGPPPDPPPPVSYPPSISTPSLPMGAIGVAYAEALAVVNGTPAYGFTVAAGALPAGLALNAATGEIAGTPSTSGSGTFIVTVTDSAGLTGSASFTIVIPSQPMIQNTSLPSGGVGLPFLASLVGFGGAGPYGFRVIAGGLPSGLSLATTGGITGTPTVAGTFPLTIQVYDSNSPQGIGSSTFSISILSAALSNPVTTIDASVLIACADGAVRLVVPGQRHDEAYDGTPVGFLQQWNGVRGPSGSLALMQLGGASVSAKGNGALNVYAIANDGTKASLSSDRRPMSLTEVETSRDFIAKGVPHSERYGIGFNNGGVADAWFELHVAILWVRKFFGSRKA